MAYVRKYKTGSGAIGVQVCYKRRGEVVKTVHIGSANSPQALDKMLQKAQELIDAEKMPLFDLRRFEKEGRTVKKRGKRATGSVGEQGTKDKN